MNPQFSEHSDQNKDDLSLNHEVSSENSNSIQNHIISNNKTKKKFINVPIQTDNLSGINNFKKKSSNNQNCEFIDNFNIQISNHENFCNSQINKNFIDDNSQCNIKQDPVRTLFVSGLPLDVRERELYLLFQNFQGFHCATLRHVGTLLSRPVAFVTFENRKDAVFALKKMNGTYFDSQSNAILKIEFAKSNTKFLKSNQFSINSQHNSSNNCIN